MKNFLKKLSKIISNILFWILMGVIILLVFYIVTIKIYAKQNRLDEIKFNMYTILTTSMEKTIMAGDVVVDYKNKDNIYELGLTEVETPMGNKVRVYDIERCICDIIRSKKRMDSEYVKYSIREYIKRKDKDLIKLSKYADKMGIKNEVMNFVEVFYE